MKIYIFSNPLREIKVKLYTEVENEWIIGGN